MIILTGYYRDANLDLTETRNLAISLTVPTRYTGHRYPALAPPAKLLRQFNAGRCDWSEYAEAYEQYVLARLDRQQVLAEIQLMCGDSPRLLCHCKDHSICHRQLVRRWLEWGI